MRATTEGSGRRVGLARQVQRGLSFGEVKEEMSGSEERK